MEKHVIIAIIKKDYLKAKVLLKEMAKYYRISLPKFTTKDDLLEQRFLEFIENSNGYKETIKNLYKEL